MIKADVANTTIGERFRTHVAAAENAGVTKPALREAMLHLAYYVSFPKAMEATAELVRICGPFEPERDAIDISAAPDASVVKLLTGGPVSERLREMDGGLAELSFRVSTNLWRRPLLTPKERAYMCLATNVCNQTLGDPFDVSIALRTGATPAALREVIIQMAYCASFPKALQAMLALERQLKPQSRQLNGFMQQAMASLGNGESGISLG